MRVWDDLNRGEEIDRVMTAFDEVEDDGDEADTDRILRLPGRE
jgi:hypothetical protein